MTKCNGFTLLSHCTVSIMQMTFSYDSTMTTNDLNMP